MNRNQHSILISYLIILKLEALSPAINNLSSPAIYYLCKHGYSFISVKIITKIFHL